MQSLTRWYGTRRAVESVDLTVSEGSIFGFLGPNGAGKTTTIRILTGLLRPSSGTAHVFEWDCWHDSHRVKRDVGYLAGEMNLYPWMTGREAIWIAGRVRKQDTMSQGKELAELFDLDLSVKVRRMSRGMRQKLGLILAMAHRPRLMILDEPSSGLDPLMQDRLRDYLRREAREGHTIFFSSHALSEVEELCDRVAIIRAGRVVADQSLDDLRKQAGYQIFVRWSSCTAAAAEPPEFLQVTRQTEDSWWGLVTGQVGPLINWLADRPVADLSVGRPDLETLFRQYYQVDETRT